jgi:multiple sugar transport system permease protein
VTRNTNLGILRYAAAVMVTAIFLFPLFWWALTSIKPSSAIFDIDHIVFFDFMPTWDNYQVTLFGGGPVLFDSRRTLSDSLVVALGATSLTIALALPASFALSFLWFRLNRAYYLWSIFQRFLPPIVAVIPLVVMFHFVGLLDTRAGLIMAHTAMNLPFAVLILKSFFDEVPREVGEAAAIDGASRFQIFFKIFTPMIKGGIAATAVLCFIFSWTEFLQALFLTNSIRTLPVQALNVMTVSWGFTSALTTTAMIPCFIFILLSQRHLVRGLTMGFQKG